MARKLFNDYFRYRVLKERGGEVEWYSLNSRMLFLLINLFIITYYFATLKYLLFTNTGPFFLACPLEFQDALMQDRYALALHLASPALQF
jgi:hypothetical protein